MPGMTQATTHPAITSPAIDWQAAVDEVRAAARDGRNLMPPILAAVEAHATVGEISDAMRRVFGEHAEITTI